MEGFRSLYATSQDGVKIHFLLGGEGQKTILLLHGWPGFWKDWEKVMHPLSKHARVAALDLRGFGESGKPDEPERYSFDHYAADIQAVVDELDAEDVVLCGFDIGSSTSAYFARKNPSVVKGLVLMNPSYPGLGKKRLEPQYAAENWYQFFHNYELAEKLVGYNKDTLTMYLKHFFERWSFRKEAFKEHDIREYVEVFWRHGLRGGFNWYRARVKTRYGDWLGGPVETLTEILWSDHDPVFPLEWSSDVKKYFPNSSLRIVKDCGHFIPREAPDEVVRGVLRILSAEGFDSSEKN